MATNIPREQREEFTKGLPSANLSELQGGAPAAAFGGDNAVLKGVSDAAGEIGMAVQKEKDKADDTLSIDYYAKLARKKQELFWDPKAGAMMKKGKDSFSAVDEYGKQFDEFANSLETDLNPRQRAMTKRIRDKERAEFDGQLMQHVAKEAGTYQAETVKSGIEAAQNDAIMAGGDINVVRQKIGLQEAIYHQTSSGKPPAQVEVEVKELRSKTHAAVIGRMVDNGADQAAHAYFEKAKGELYGNDIHTTEKLLKSGYLNGESQRKADQIFYGTRTQETAYAEVAKIQDINLRDETTKRLDAHFSRKVRMEKEREESELKFAANIVDQTKTVTAIPRSQWNSFSPEKRSMLENYEKHKREGTQPVTNWSVYYNLQTMSAEPRLRDKFKQLDLMTVRNQMADAEFKELVKAQDGLRGGDSKTAALLDGVRTDQEIVNTGLVKAGIDPNSKKEADADSYGSFRRQVDERVVALQEKTGKKVTSKELQGIVDDLTIEGVTQKRWYWSDVKKKKFELKPGETLQFSIDQVPANDRAQIEDVLKKRGLKPTDDKILELYEKKVAL